MSIAQDKRETRPLVTLALLTYNQSKYVREAVNSVLSQSYSPLEIILSDDNSNDGTCDILIDAYLSYTGPHQLSVRQSRFNLGIALHFSEILKHANGEIVVVAAGDDISLPCRCSEVVKKFAEVEGLTFIDVNAIDINKTGERLSYGRKFDGGEISLERYLIKKPRGLSGACRAYRKSAIDVFPSLDSNCPTEDSPSTLRSLLLGNGYLLDKVLVLRRSHDKNLSGESSMRHINLDEIFSQYMRDISFTWRSGIVSESLKMRLLIWADKEIKERKLIQEIRNGRLISNLLNIFQLVRFNHDIGFLFLIARVTIKTFLRSLLRSFRY